MIRVRAILLIVSKMSDLGDTITPETQLKDLSYEQYTRNRQVLEDACRARLLSKDEYQRIRRLFVNWEQQSLVAKLLLAQLVQVLRESNEASVINANPG